MSDTPEAPPLLSPERLAEILARAIAPTSYTDPDAALDVAALLAERDHWMNQVIAAQHAHLAFRQQVAAELRGLLVSVRPLSGCFDPKAQERERINRVYNAEIEEVANRLNINLSATPDPSL